MKSRFTDAMKKKIAEERRSGVKGNTILTPGLSSIALCEGGSEKTSSVFICVADYAVTSK